MSRFQWLFKLATQEKEYKQQPLSRLTQLEGKKKKDISNQQRNSTQFFGPTKHWTEKIYNFKDWPFNHLPGSMLTYAFFFFVCFFSSIVRGFPVVCAFRYQQIHGFCYIWKMSGGNLLLFWSGGPNYAFIYKYICKPYNLYGLSSPYVNYLACQIFKVSQLT